MRRAILLGLVCAGGIVACERQPAAPPTTGSIALRIVADARAAATAPTPGAPALAAAGHLDAARVRIFGMTNLTVNLTPGPSGFSGTVDGLPPGGYTVVVEGLVATEVDYFGVTQNVQVNAGQTTSPTISFNSFRPVVADLGPPTAGLVFTARFSRVPNAQSYKVEWDKNPAFASPASTGATDTVVTITVPDTGTYSVRVRAANGWEGPGRASDAKALWLVGAPPPLQNGVVLSGLAGAAGADRYFAIQVPAGESQLAVAVAGGTGSANPYVRFGSLPTPTTFDCGPSANGTSYYCPNPATGNWYILLHGVSAYSGVALSATYGVSALVTTAAATAVTSTAATLNGSANPNGTATTAWLEWGTDPALATVTATASQALGAGTTAVAVSATVSGLAPGTTYYYRCVASNGGGMAKGQILRFRTFGPPAKLIFSTQPSNALPASAISPPVQVTVQDTSGRTVPDATTTITVAIGTNPAGGTLAGTASVNAIGGVATFSGLSIDKTGAGYTLTAAATGLAGATSTAFDVVARKLAFTVQPSTATAGAVITPAVQVAVQDSLGRTITTATNGVTLVIATNPAGGTLAGTLTVAAVNGVATFSNLSIDKASSGYALGASATGIAGAASTAFTITPGAATQLGFSVQPSNVTAGAAIAPAVQVAVQDSRGNSVTNATPLPITVALGTNPSGGTLSGTTTVSTVNGVATFANLSIDKVGGYTLTATPASPSTLTAATSVGFNTTFAAATKLAFTAQPSNTVAGASIAPAVQVTVQDAFGNTVPTGITGVTLAIGTNAAAGTLSGTTTVPPGNGVATFSNLSIDKAGTGYTLTATATTLTGATSTAFNIAPGAANRVGFVVQPSDALAGTAIAPAVQVAVQDYLGNTVASATNSITVAIGSNPSGGVLSGTTTVNAANGVASFATLSIDKPGAYYTLVATSTGLSQSPWSNSFNISLYKLAFSVQPTTTTAGAVITPAVQVAIQDATGTTVTSATNTVSVLLDHNPGNAYLYGTTSVAATSGVATFSTLSLNPVATGYTLRASGSNLSGVTSTAFDITPGTPTNLGFTVQPTNATAGTAIAPAVKVAVRDNQGNTVPSATNPITITIRNNPAGGTLSGTLTVNAVSGVATFSNLRLNKPGNYYSLTASASGLTAVGSSYFNITVAPASRLVFAVQPTRAVAGGAIAPAVQVAVTDSLGNTVPSAANSITMAIGTNPGAGTLSGTATVSAASGVAVFANLIIDKTGSGYTLAASSSGLTGVTSSAFDVVAPVTTRIGTIGAGSSHSCSISSSGAAYCWGYGGDGELGNGSTASSLTPVLVSGGLTFASVSVAYYHACGITTSGVAYCWGGGGSGQLGNGASVNSSVPVLVSGGLTFASVSAGYISTCGVTTSGAAYCWGYGANGELGNGSTANSLTPVLVSGGLTFAAVSAAYGHACGVTTSGAAYCWGAGGDGQLGNGGTSSTTPVPVSGTLTFASVTTGSYHSCGVTTSGAGYCWGRNYYGELGSGSTAGSLVPALVSGGLTFAAMSAGNYDGCGIVTSGAAYCWGLDDHGQLGNGGTGNQTTPALVSGGLTFTSLSAGVVHTCGITSGGAAYCWGDDEQNGRLGNGSAVGLTTPVPVAGGLAYSVLSAGAGHACAVATGGAAYCWGRAADGQLGYGSTGNQPGPIAVSTTLTFATVGAGGRHSCGVATGGAAYCWGYGGNGQLGNNATLSNPTPVAVSGGLVFASVGAGDIHTCGVTTAGAAYCWGQGDLGQLGSGSLTSSAAPVAVTGALTFATVSAGYRHSCGVTTAGAGYCWGSNGGGQLGNGSTTTSASPGAVSGGLTFASVSAGFDYSCGVTTNGGGYCWGGNGAGQLGNGTTTASLTPVLVSGTLALASIKADSAHTCAVTTGGATYCWGANPSGQLGNFSTLNSAVPVLVATGLSFQSATVGTAFSCGVTTNGTGYCWGLLAEGSLGNGSPYGSTTPVPVAGGLTFQAAPPVLGARAGGVP